MIASGKVIQISECGKLFGLWNPESVIQLYKPGIRNPVNNWKPECNSSGGLRPSDKGGGGGGRSLKSFLVWSKIRGAGPPGVSFGSSGKFYWQWIRNQMENPATMSWMTFHEATVICLWLNWSKGTSTHPHVLGLFTDQLCVTTLSGNHFRRGSCVILAYEMGATKSFI